MRECELRCSWDINKGEEGALSWGGVGLGVNYGWVRVVLKAGAGWE